MTHRVFDLERGERVETCIKACAKFWIVQSGTAAICVSLPDGRRQITGIERAGGTVCGPMANEDSPVWLEALESCQICELDLGANMAELQGNPDFLRVMFSVVHRRLEAVTQHMITLGRLDSTERVTLFLAETALGWTGPGPVQLPMNREAIADYLGLNAETVSRILTRLRKTGTFKFLSRTEYLVPDMAAVRRRVPVALTAPEQNPIQAAAAGTPPEEYAK
ncbi:Crp/Fnr family transcriptional regulator [Aliiroseovarius subalbicans]|uniref:Crp/Fnr family transcriptional regulator n=1 Tax=Aliiroseovarius subalbicans TaxID=2925840 RepID=UPI001F59DFCF|nr:Crp/Fnr family transcriptional regulator [Aliiroseovarius subalbicans]MCI2399647.1 Crp/Fnr family transcriptional regulator [Aliiroseovarius subalbicans]